MADLSSIAVDERGPAPGGAGSTAPGKGQKRAAETAPDSSRAGAGGGTKSPKLDAESSAGENLERMNRLRELEALSIRELILKIRAWCSAFPDITKDIIKSVNLESEDEHSLKSLLDQIRFTVATRTIGIVTTDGAQGLLHLAEELIDTHTSIKVKGPTARLTDLGRDPNFQDLVKETMLDNAHWLYTKPVYRLIYYCGQGLYKIDSANRTTVDNIRRTEEALASAEAQRALEESKRLTEAVALEK
jgi:hypothetical protein